MTGEPQLSEQEIQQLQAELDRITVDDVLIQTVVTLLNVGARKAETDRAQLGQAIEGARALVPLLEARHADKLGPVKDMLAQLQLLFAQGPGAPAEDPGAPSGGAPGQPEGPGQAQSASRLWVPGQ